MARFQAKVNLLGLLLQMFVVSRIFKYIGVRGALFILPLVVAGELRHRRARPAPRHRPRRQDAREQHRLLDPEHRPAGAVPADQPRSEVQGQAGDRLVLRPDRRHAAGGGGLRRRRWRSASAASRCSIWCWSVSGWCVGSRSPASTQARPGRHRREGSRVTACHSIRWSLVVCLVWRRPLPAAAQDRRATAVVAAEQAEKAKQLRPYRAEPAPSG